LQSAAVVQAAFAGGGGVGALLALALPLATAGLSSDLLHPSAATSANANIFIMPGGSAAAMPPRAHAISGVSARCLRHA